MAPETADDFSVIRYSLYIHVTDTITQGFFTPTSYTYLHVSYHELCHFWIHVEYKYV